MQAPAHAFWPADLDIASDTAIDSQAALGSRQLTDACRLARAFRLSGRFVTLDHGVPLAAVARAAARARVLLVR